LNGLTTAPSGATRAPTRTNLPAPELLGWFLVALMLPLLGLVKILPADVPWHLATARLAAATGHWPIHNTFSWTYPDYPLYQQYPIFQTIVFAAYRLGGWQALSALVCLGWTTVFALYVRAGGPWSRALPFAPFWALVAFSLQTRTVLRPDLVSLGLLGCYLLIFDAYRRRRAVLALVPALHWSWVNGHQLFILSLVVQLLFLGHLLLCRWGRLGVDRQDAPLPLWPVLAVLAASIALSFASPLGAGVLQVFRQTAGSVAHHRGQVDELAPVWSDPVWLAIALAVVVPATAALLRGHRRWSPFEVGLWLLVLAMAATAIRGLPYATLLGGTLLQRALLRQPLVWPTSQLLRRYFSWLGMVLAAALTLAVLQHRWLAPPSSLYGTQAGLGRTEGDWPDAGIAALKPDPPPGRMMNLSWPLANDLIWDWPEQPVFVDPRFEAYPRPFLVDALASRTSDESLGRLIDAHRPGWILAEHCRGPERDRVARLVRGGHWQVTYADVQVVALVARSPRSEAYRARHLFSPAREPGGMVRAPLGRRARQRLCYGRLLGLLGFAGEARSQLAEAEGEARDDHALRAEIARVAQELPTETMAP
jgi:hypothetical protein